MNPVVWILAALVLGATAPAQVREISGTFSVLVGKEVVSGAWTARLDAEADVGWGTWRLFNAERWSPVRGTWTARKRGDEWSGSWRTQQLLQTGQQASDITGEWSATSDLPPESAVIDLIRSAAKQIVSGSWSRKGVGGTWSIRTYQGATGKKRHPEKRLSAT